MSLLGGDRSRESRLTALLAELVVEYRARTEVLRQQQRELQRQAEALEACVDELRLRRLEAARTRASTGNLI